MSTGGWVACVLTALLIAGSLSAYSAYYSITGNIDTAQVDTDGWDRPTDIEGIHNILIMGADVRTGENAEYGKVAGIRPDVTAVASFNADNGAVTLVNLPRDLMVDIPRCDPAGEDFPGTPGRFDQINHAMAYGGASCQWKTVEELTGVHLDHFTLVDFVGFKDIVNTIGGVPMCIPEPIDDPKAKLHLEAGEQVLDGEQALGLARSRDSTEFGSDLGRIDNQQRMMGSIVRTVTGGDTLSRPTTVYDFLGAVTDSLRTDDEFTVEAMADLAIAMRDVDLDRISFVTPPVVEYPQNENKVVLKERPASELFEAVAAGEVLPGEAEEEKEDGSDDDGGDGGSGEGDGGVDPADVSVSVLNNTARSGLGAETGDALGALGFTVADVGNPVARFPEATTVYHGPGRKPRAEALSAVLGAAATEEVAGMSGGVELVIADDWAGVEGGGAAGEGSSASAESAGDEEQDTSVAEELGGTTAATDEKARTCD
ncbi:LCP family protein [Streptomonospora salina]|uniref:LCP family protein required for cell wall assembly n=1 Tax=Streptomonospora salina TaxID=104205 RepID=A0A841E6I9_9ACTN|nr:LCP family protein [Streptomonospora salina]MBB5998626.1 LCP family protein required for cell wall assembly [Streptomonospora salina]